MGNTEVNAHLHEIDFLIQDLVYATNKGGRCSACALPPRQAVCSESLYLKRNTSKVGCSQVPDVESCGNTQCSVETIEVS